METCPRRDTKHKYEPEHEHNMSSLSYKVVLYSRSCWSFNLYIEMTVLIGLEFVSEWEKQQQQTHWNNKKIVMVVIQTTVLLHSQLSQCFCLVEPIDDTLKLKLVVDSCGVPYFLVS